MSERDLGRLCDADAMAEHGGERGHQLGVELRSAAGANLIHRFVGRAYRAVGARQRHRVEGIGQRDDPAFERDLVVRGAGRVAAAIEPLAGGANEQGDFGQGGHRGQRFGADGGVALDFFAFGGGERQRLVHDRARDAQLADVVEPGGKGDASDGRCIEAEVDGEARGQFGRDLAVVGKFRIVQTDGGQQAFGRSRSVRILRALSGSHGTRGAQIVEGFLPELVGEADAIGEPFAGLRHLMDDRVEAAEDFITAGGRAFEVDPRTNAARIVRPLSFGHDLHT